MTGGTGRTALVTGAGRGMGRAIATGFAQAGYRVMLLGRSAATLAEVEQILRAAGHDVFASVGDVGEPDAVGHAADLLMERWGRIDVLVNNAGISGEETPILEVTEAAWDEVIRTNLKGPLLMSQAAGRHMARQGGGVILHNASIAGLAVDGAFAAYGVAKAGLLALMRSMAVELAPLGIRVNAVSPGYTRTDMTTGFLGPDSPIGRPGGFARAPSRRLVEPEEVASAFIYLASPEASGITGANLVVDGGLTANLYITETL